MAKVLAVLYAVAANLVFLPVFVYFIGFVGNAVVPKSIDSGPPGETLGALLIDFALLALFFVQHTLMARAGCKKILASLMPPATERSTYVLLSSAALALLCWQWRPLPGVIWQVDHRVLSILLTALFGLGWGIALVAAKAFDVLELLGLRQLLAWLRGGAMMPTPFATPGLYRLVRHPMMTGFLISFWATPTMTVGHLLFALAMTIYIVIAVKCFEERDLKEAFGEKYAAYQREVPMLFPGGRPRP